mmetsp:Transcript_42841/g.126936  ORF Transcript_42841/g.126936 Transcript_42841/m.126936 type:complete len:698 (-) Transcript_42841:3-2096(-)
MAPPTAPGPGQDDDKAKMKQAAEIFKHGQAVLKKAALAQGDDAAREYEHCVHILTEAIALRPNHAQYYQTRGRCFVAMQQYQRALFDFSQCVRNDPDTAKHYGNRGLCYRRLGRTEEALRDYTDALRRLEKDHGEASQRQAAEYYLERGLVYMDLEQYHDAVQGFGQALEKRLVQTFKALYHRGICYRKVGMLTESIENLKQAIAQEPNNADAHNHLGLSYVEEASYEEAKKSFTTASEHDNCARFLNNRGLASFQLAATGSGPTQYEEAIEDFTAALVLEPETASIHFNRGNARFQLGLHAEALEDYGEAIAREPASAIYLHHKGLAFQGMGSVQEAIAAYEEALRKDPNNHPSRFHLGIMYHKAGQLQRALDAFNSVAPEDEALFEARGLLFRDMGDYRKALADFCAVLDLEPEVGKHYYNRGVVYYRMGLEQDAISDLSQAVELGSTGADVFSERGLAYRAQGNMAQAVIDLTAAIEADPAQTQYLSNRAQCLFEQGLYDRAEIDLCKAIQLDGRDADLLYKRGITRYAQRRYSEAIADLKAALAFQPEPDHEADICYHLGVSYANLGKHSLAVDQYDTANMRAPGRPHYLHERAKSLQVVEEHEKALRDFTQVIDMQPTNARALFRRAFSFKAQGLYEEAAEDFEAAKEFAPDDPRLVINYRKVYDVSSISLGPCGHEDPEISGVTSIVPSPN